MYSWQEARWRRSKTAASIFSFKTRGISLYGKDEWPYCSLVVGEPTMNLLVGRPSRMPWNVGRSTVGNISVDRCYLELDSIDSQFHIRARLKVNPLERSVASVHWIKSRHRSSNRHWAIATTNVDYDCTPENLRFEKLEIHGRIHGNWDP